MYADHDRLDDFLDGVFRFSQHGHHDVARNGHSGLDDYNVYACYSADHDIYGLGNACNHDAHNGAYTFGSAYNHYAHNDVYVFDNVCTRDDHDGVYSDAFSVYGSNADELCKPNPQAHVLNTNSKRITAMEDGYEEVARKYHCWHCCDRLYIKRSGQRQHFWQNWVP